MFRTLASELVPLQSISHRAGRDIGSAGRRGDESMRSDASYGHDRDYGEFRVMERFSGGVACLVV